MEFITYLGSVNFQRVLASLKSGNF